MVVLRNSVGSLAEEEEVCSSSPLVVPRGGVVPPRLHKLARARGVDAREVDVAVHRAEHRAQANQHQQHDQTDEHGHSGTQAH